MDIQILSREVICEWIKPIEIEPDISHQAGKNAITPTIIKILFFF
jgi:hypothetical protein